MQKLPKNSKQWWSLAKQLMRRNSSASFFPPLRSRDGTWLLEPKEKADALTDVLNDKFHLPVEELEIFFATPSECMPAFNAIRSRQVRRELASLREHQATSPDAIPAVLLRVLAHVIDRPFAIICRMADTPFQKG